MDPLLIHFSAIPCVALHSVAQADEPSFKPQGFWVSDESRDDGWAWWCRDTEFQLDALACATRVVLAPSARVCWLTTAAGILRFTDDFGAWPTYMDPFPWRVKQGYAIDWAAVAKDYQGIIITPYQWTRRLDPLTCWYYGWDCASGCLWDAAAVAALEVLPVGVTTPRSRRSLVHKRQVAHTHGP